MSLANCIYCIGSKFKIMFACGSHNARMLDEMLEVHLWPWSHCDYLWPWSHCDWMGRHDL